MMNYKNVHCNKNKPLKKQYCLWIYHNSHNHWETSCGQSYDANKFGCDEIEICPNCEKETTTI